jgi:uncharacterized protein
MAGVTASAESMTLVTQTRVLPGEDAAFAAWQQRVRDTAATFPGFLEQSVLEPAPPTQVDWVIIQRFASIEAAQTWLRSDERRRLLAEVESILLGPDDIHLFRGGPGRPPEESVSAVISTRVAPGGERAFRTWQRRIAAAEASFPGFQGSKLEPPIPGVQEDWATISRFDSEEHLQAWLTSPQRRQLVDEAAAFGAESRVRTMRGGFEGYFNREGRAGSGIPASWKVNMVTLLVLYPIVFLYGQWVFEPLLQDWGVPFWLDLFIAKVISVALMGFFLVAPINRALAWWLVPSAGAPRWTTAAGAAVVVAFYAIWLTAFSLFP